MVQVVEIYACGRKEPFIPYRQNLAADGPASYITRASAANVLN